jgi:hypothetical protein
MAVMAVSDSMSDCGIEIRFLSKIFLLLQPPPSYTEAILAAASDDRPSEPTMKRLTTSVTATQTNFSPVNPTTETVI